MRTLDHTTSPATPRAGSPRRRLAARAAGALARAAMGLALAVGTAAPVALAQQDGAAARPHLRVTGQGENFAVEYDPAYEGSVAGGGLMLAQPVEDPVFGTMLHDASRAQGAIGVPTVVTSGENTDIAYMPFPSAPTRLFAQRSAR